MIPMRGAALAATIALAGCANMSQPFAGMSAEQISAAVKDKDASATCVRSPTPWGQAVVVWVNVDANVVKNGGLTIGGDCTATFSNAPVTAPGTTTTVTTIKAAP